MGINVFENEQQLNFIIESVRKNKEFPSLCAVWYYCLFFKADVVKQENMCEIESSMPQSLSTKDERIIGYILQHGCFKVDEEKIQSEYKKFKQELIVMAQEMELEPIKDLFEKLLSRYQYWLSMIKQSNWINVFNMF